MNEGAVGWWIVLLLCAVFLIGLIVQRVGPLPKRLRDRLKAATSALWVTAGLAMFVWVWVDMLQGTLRAVQERKTSRRWPLSALVKRLGPKVELIEYRASADRRGHLVLHDLRLLNHSDFPAKDVEVTCSQVAPSGTALGDLKGRLYQRLGPSQTLAVADGWDLGAGHPQTQTARCEVTGARAAD